MCSKSYILFPDKLLKINILVLSLDVSCSKISRISKTVWTLDTLSMKSYLQQIKSDLMLTKTLTVCLIFSIMRHKFTAGKFSHIRSNALNIV